MIQVFFCRTCHGLSNAVYRLSLSFLVFELSGGGAVIRPPPGRAKVAQTPGRARVKNTVLVGTALAEKSRAAISGRRMEWVAV